MHAIVTRLAGVMLKQSIHANRLKAPSANGTNLVSTGALGKVEPTTNPEKSETLSGAPIDVDSGGSTQDVVQVSKMWRLDC